MILAGSLFFFRLWSATASTASDRAGIVFVHFDNWRSVPERDDFASLIKSLKFIFCECDLNSFHSLFSLFIKSLASFGISISSVAFKAYFLRGNVYFKSVFGHILLASIKKVSVWSSDISTKHSIRCIWKNTLRMIKITQINFINTSHINVIPIFKCNFTN
jgi:hypothetical protein